MRFILLLICYLFSVVGAQAQKTSRIVFFRMDAPVGSKSASYLKSQYHSDELFKDDTVIAEMPSSSVFLYNTQSLAGVYFRTPKTDPSHHLQTMKLKDRKGVIVFVKTGFFGGGLSGQTPEVISFPQFKNCYDNTKWLRRELKNAGYPSLAKLMEGYEPIEKDSIQVRTVSAIDYAEYFKDFSKRNVSDTVFFGEYNEEVDRSKATSFSVAAGDSSGLFRIEDYYSKSGHLKQMVYWATLDSESREGRYVSYYANGRIESEGRYNGNIKEGEWINYYDTIGNPVWYKRTYVSGEIEGSLNSYYRSGQLKRTEIHKTYTDTVVYRYKGNSRFYVNELDSVINSHCYDRSGNEIEFTPFETLPHASYDIQEYLAKTIRFPISALENNIQGKVVIQFVVNKNGVVEKPVIVRSVSPDIDDVCIKVIKGMKDWNPGIRDDKVVDFPFRLPIKFKID